jgi:putative transposase
MISMPLVPTLKGFRYPREVISYAVSAYYRFSMSLREVVDLLAARGVVVSHESVREWINRFGPQIAARIRRDRPTPADQWHLDELAIMIQGEPHWLWRAVDSEGDVLEILVQKRRNATAAKRFLHKLMRQ